MFPKKKNEPLGVMLIESGFGSPIPSCVIAAMSKNGSAQRSGLLNVGDHIISLNGVNFVGLPVKTCIWHVKVCVCVCVCVCVRVCVHACVRMSVSSALG